MKTFTPPITTEMAADQSGWCEVYDFYLKASINTPYGTTDVIRITTLPGNLNFFTPKVVPEPAGTQGAAATYFFWPLTREVTKSSAKFANDKLTIAVSNVTQEWAAMLAAVDWEAVPVVIRKVNTAIPVPTADDCAQLFSGSIDKGRVTLESIQFTASNDFSSFNTTLPREAMHPICRFKWADDNCAVMRFSQFNYKSKTVGAASTTTVVKSADLTEDNAGYPQYGALIDLIEPLGNPAITTSSEQVGFEGYRIKISEIDYWACNTGDWGTNNQGYWLIPDAQAGLANYQLKPWIQFDFGSAKTARTWMVSSRGDFGRDSMVRLILIFSSTDNISWKHETYFEMPPVPAQTFQVYVPGAQPARWWRICVRSRWSETLKTALFNKVQAYEEVGHWWTHGQITFAANTTTLALRGVTRTITASFAGQVFVGELPAAPVAGDTFLIERGCSRTFNACCHRQNWEKFGGFDSMPFETVAR